MLTIKRSLALIIYLCLTTACSTHSTTKPTPHAHSQIKMDIWFSNKQQAKQ